MEASDSRRLHQAIAAAGSTLDFLAAVAGLRRRSGEGTALPDMVKRLYEERRERDRCFPPGLFGEPAWDLILALFVARHESRSLTIRDACAAARAPKTTGRRLLARLQEAGLIEVRRAEGPRKGLRVGLTQEGCDRLADYLTRIL